MNLKQYILIFAFGTTTAFISWIIVITQLNPTESGIAGLLAFYITFFAWFMGLLSIIGTSIRAANKDEKEHEEHPISRSLRQAFLLSVLVTSTLLLLSNGFLRLWILVLLIVSVGLIESFALSLKQKKR